MLLTWLKSRRRRQMSAQPFPEEYERLLQRNVVHDKFLDDSQRTKLRRLMQVFIAEKNWEGCRGLELTDEMKVTIAAQACLLVVGMDHDEHFDHVQSILVYPSSYVAKDVELTRAGVVIEGRVARLGETLWRGPVVLSWPHVLAGGRMQTPGHNLVFHEFAHQLDMLNGRVADGTPILDSPEIADKWRTVMEAEYRELDDACRQRRRHLLDCYGTTDPCEFFAVSTECFFERGSDFQHWHPQLYELLRGFYRLDPATWGT
jgi:Mlc titration factor MtfA (ptsG expression regulator)